MKILKYLKQYWVTALVIFALLMVQAYCDLSLPTYTSRIVDVGIQQGGIANAAATTLRPETMDALRGLMTEDEAATVDAAYTLQDGLYTLNPGVDTAAVSAALQTPMALQGTAGAQGQALPAEQLSALRAQLAENTSDSLLLQRAVQFVRDEYAAQGVDTTALQTSYLLHTGGIMLALTLLMVVAVICVGFLASRTGAAIGRGLRGQLFAKVLSFSNAEMDRFSTASLITRSTNDVQQVQMVTIMLLRMILYAPIMAIGGVLKVMNTHTGLDWIIVVAVGCIFVLVFALMKVTMPRFQKMQLLVDKLNLVSREILTGLLVIRAFSREEHEKKRFDAASRDLMDTQLFTNRAMSLMMPCMMLIMNGITLLIVWFGAKGVDLGRLQVGDMMAFITYTMQIVMSFMMLTMVSIMLPRANVAAGRIDEVLSTEASIVDKPETKDNTRTSWPGRVEYKNVTFRYPGAEDDVLHDISFTAEPGKTTAFIGSTGSGKSTLVHLLPRFYDVTEGSVCVDGVDIRDLSQHKLHSLIGFVPQKGVLFSGTIESNLRFGGEDEVSAEDARRAAEIAQAADFIDEKPEKDQSPVAQGGTNVSGGQKQRLCIARAIARHPQILVFDDSFSALDYKTDVALRKALHENLSDTTVLIVAQRISTILHADEILVLDEGRLVGKGTHAELLQTCPTYAEIAHSQLSEEELKGGAAL